MIYIILLSYLIIIFWGSLIESRPRQATPESYFLANRNLTTLSLFFTLLATNFSAFYFLGFAGQGYKVGYSIYILMALGTGIAGLAFLLIGPRIWKLGKSKGYITPAELIYGETKSRSLAWLFSAVMIIFTLPYLALQIIGGGYILENVTGGELSYALSITLLTIITIAYVVIGGMASVARTDLKQGGLMIALMITAVVLIAKDLGGISYANEQAQLIRPELFTPEGTNNFHHPRKWFSFLVFWFFCVPMFPQLFMRFYVAADVATLKKSAVMYAFIPILISILPVMIGIWGHVSFPDLSGKDTDQILPKMLVEHTSSFFVGLVMTGAIAAFMSTLDSQLLALSTMVTRDFYLPLRKTKLSLKHEVFVARLIVVVLAFIGLIIAWNPFDTIFDMGKMSFTGLAVLFPVSFVIVRYGNVRPKVAMVSIVLGLILLFGFYYKHIPIEFAFEFEFFIIIVVLCSLVTFLGRLPRKDK